MRPEYTPEVFGLKGDVWDMTKPENWVVKPLPIKEKIVDAYKLGDVIMENKKLEVAEVTDGNDTALVNLKGLGQAIGEMLKDAVEKATNIALQKGNKPIQVVLGDGKEIKEVQGYSHEKLPTLLRILSARLPLFLVGEAGSGKTHLVEQCAEALGLKFYCISVCAQTTASALLGYMDANGKYVRSLFREAYENGGVFLLDEVDNGNPNVLSVLNASISNHVCAFPDQMIKKHPDFILCASGNTYGHGANRKYVGRLEIDGATLDRFVFVEIGYDNKLEEQICGNKAYANLIQAIRKRANELKLRHIISPRASINGVKLLQSGMDLNEVLQCTVFRDMSPDVFAQLKENKEVKEAMESVKGEKKKARKKKAKKSEIKEGDKDSEDVKKISDWAEKIYSAEYEGKSEGDITEGAF